MKTTLPIGDAVSALAARNNAIEVLVHTADYVQTNLRQIATEIDSELSCTFSHRPEWLLILRDGLGHQTFLLQAVQNNRSVGWLPLAFVQSRLFGRFLVSLPYLNSAGLATACEKVGYALIDRAIHLANELNVRYLELRHEERCRHAGLDQEATGKVHMRLPLPSTTDELWRQLGPKVRNQVRKAEKHGLEVQWGGIDRLDEFYAVFSRNMRDLGTPAFGKKLFEAILRRFPEAAELCIVRSAYKPIAAGLLLHGPGTTEVPSASSLRSFNSTNANMLMYWHLLCRTIERNQHTFDFGRSSLESNTYRFKEQWGAQPHPAIWQYHLRHGSIDAMRPTSPRYQRKIAVWKRLPLWLTRLAGPAIVRGIP